MGIAIKSAGEVVSGVLHITQGPLLETDDFLAGKLANKLGRAAEIKGTGFQFLIMGDQAAGAKNDSFANHGPVQHNRPDSHQRLIFDGAGMQANLMAHRDIIADFAAAIGFHMKQRKVLDIGVTANGNFMNVPAHHNMRPNTGIIPKGHLAYNLRRRIHKNLLTDFRRQHVIF